MWLEARNRRILEGPHKLEAADVAQALHAALAAEGLHAEPLIPGAPASDSPES